MPHWEAQIGTLTVPLTPEEAQALRASLPLAPGPGTTAGHFISSIVSFVSVALVIGALIAIGALVINVILPWLNERDDARLKQEALEAAKTEWPFPTLDQFLTRLSERVGQPTPLPLLLAAQTAYHSESNPQTFSFSPTLMTTHIQSAAINVNQLADSTAEAFSQIAPFFPTDESVPSQFTAPLYAQIPDLPKRLTAFCHAFAQNELTGYTSSFSRHLALVDPGYERPYNLFQNEKSVAHQISENLVEVSREGLSKDALRQRKLLWPTEFKGTPEEMIQAYLKGTPFLSLFQSELPFNIPDSARFRHQFIVGPTGSGKTTLLSNLIANDLERVARDEASVFVIDSQNELIPEIAKLTIFGPGGALEGKLIYIEPDPDYPLALNIFDVNKDRAEALSRKDQMMLESGAMWMVEFFLSSLVKSEATAQQDTFLHYLIPAVMAIPDATIFTLKDLLEKGGYDRYKQHFYGLRPDHQKWLETRLHSPEVAVTRNAIRTRLDGFTARGFFHDMFAHPRNKLDLFKELQSAKVILVNTMGALLKSSKEPFGRLFIARLLQATEERMFVEKSSRLPVFAYIDEAGDYISEEENIAELIDKARKQFVGLTIAVQRTEHITSPNVLGALKSAAIQCWGEQQPVWNISIDRNPPVQVTVPHIDFATAPKMPPHAFEALMREMHARYCAPLETMRSQPVEVAVSKTEPPFDEDSATRPSQNY